MNPFNAYAKYYDRLYQDKSYEDEVSFIIRTINRFPDSAGRTLLDLGCGTGKHSVLFSKKGYRVSAVDRSKKMIAEAVESATRLGLATDFINEDICNLNLGIQFDIVTSLFHVMSYLTENKALQKAFNVACKHVKPNGLFLFDFWYGPAVLSQKPETRVKDWVDDRTRIVRIAQPELRENRNIVDVNYEIYIQDVETKITETLKETHSMRYLFLPELEYYLQEAGFDVLAAEEWITQRTLSIDSWNGFMVCKRVS